MLGHEWAWAALAKKWTSMSKKWHRALAKKGHGRHGFGHTRCHTLMVGMIKTMVGTYLFCLFRDLSFFPHKYRKMPYCKDEVTHTLLFFLSHWCFLSLMYIVWWLVLYTWHEFRIWFVRNSCLRVTRPFLHYFFLLINLILTKISMWNWN